MTMASELHDAQELLKEFRTPEQIKKLELIPELRSKMRLWVDNTIDMIFDDLDSCSDAYEMYDVSGMIDNANTALNMDLDAVDLLQRFLDLAHYVKGVTS